MAKAEVSEQDARALQQFVKMANSMKSRHQELMREARRRADLEMAQFRTTVLLELERLGKKYSLNHISRETGISRTTLYRWLEQLQHERILAEAASRGIVIESAGQNGPAAGLSLDSLRGLSVSLEPEEVSPKGMGWSDGKRLASGEVGATDRAGNIWIFNPDTGEAWNKTENATVSGVGNWPAGAELLVDGFAE